MTIMLMVLLDRDGAVEGTVLSNVIVEFLALTSEATWYTGHNSLVAVPAYDRNRSLRGIGKTIRSGLYHEYFVNATDLLGGKQRDAQP